VRKIASISLPYIAVGFMIEHFTTDERIEVIRYIELRYQRGGGWL